MAARFRKLFRAIVVAASAPACSDPPATPDGGDADPPDVAETGLSLPDVAGYDAYVDWCEAGPPQQVCIPNAYGDTYEFVPCGLPDGVSFTDDAGTLGGCLRICPASAAHDCRVADPTAMSLYLTANCSDGAAPVDGAVDADDAGTDGGGTGVYVLCESDHSGRKPAGLRRTRPVHRGDPVAVYFANAAHLEAASVHAFRRMHDELRTLGAPRSLLARVTRAMKDEVRHARVTARIARRRGAEARGVSVRAARPRSVSAMARENITEGCVRETYGALVATWQASHAQDPEVRRVMAGIARDETRHAELSWDVARFVEAKLDPRARASVARARARAIAKLYERTSREPGSAIVDQIGAPRARDARRLVGALAATVWV